MGGVYKTKSPSLLFTPSIKTCYDIASLLQGDEWYAINKDGQALIQSVVYEHIQIGEILTSELGWVSASCYMFLQLILICS